MLIQQNTVYDFRKFRKKLTEAEKKNLPANQKITRLLKKRKSSARKVFIGLVAISIIMYTVLMYTLVIDEVMLYAILGFLILVFALSYVTYNKYNKDLADGSMYLVKGEISAAENNDNPLKSKALITLTSGRSFYIPRFAFPKDVDIETTIGRGIKFYYSPVSNEVMSIETDGIVMVGYEK